LREDNLTLPIVLLKTNSPKKPVKGNILLARRLFNKIPCPFYIYEGKLMIVSLEQIIVLACVHLRVSKGMG